MKKRTAFTLVELLTVMGIIIVLIAILLPALGRAREYSQRVRCSANLRTVLQATTHYATDNDGYLPQPNCVNKVPATTGWLYKPDPAATTPGLPPTPIVDDSLVETGALWTYINNRATYRCPMMEAPSAGQEPTKNLTSFMMNEAVVGFFTTPQRNFSYRKSQLSPRAILLWESGQGEPQTPPGGSDFNDGCDRPAEGLTARHYGGGQIGHLDDSVEYLTVEQFVAYQQPTDTHFRQLFFRPDTATGQ